MGRVGKGGRKSDVHRCSVLPSRIFNLLLWEISQFKLLLEALKLLIRSMDGVWFDGCHFDSGRVSPFPLLLLFSLEIVLVVTGIILDMMGS
jgi:hypothetical protein